jgi:hypothetical protein
MLLKLEITIREQLKKSERHQRLPLVLVNSLFLIEGNRQVAQTIW